MHDHAIKLEQPATVPATIVSNQFWLEAHASTLSSSGDICADLLHSIALAEQWSEGTDLQEVAFSLVLFCQSQLQFLRPFSLSGWARNIRSLAAQDIVELRLESCADVIELKRLSDITLAKAPGSRLAREIDAALAHSLAMLRCLDRSLEETTR